MKKISALILFMAAATGVFAQKYVPAIKAGSTIDFAVNYNGQDIPFGITVKSMADPLVLEWDIANYGTGTFEIPAKAVQGAVKMAQIMPSPGAASKLADDETFTIVSKAALDALVKTKSFTYGGTKYTDKPEATAYKINGKEADVFHVVSENGKHEMWVLNNPSFPLVCQTKGNPNGIDSMVAAIKE